MHLPLLIPQGQILSGPTISNIVVSPTFINISNNVTNVITVSYRATDTSGVNQNYTYRPQIESGIHFFREPNLHVLAATPLTVPTRLPLLLPQQRIHLESID